MYRMIAKFTLAHDGYNEKVLVAFKEGVYYYYSACYNAKSGNKFISNLHRIDSDYYRRFPEEIYHYIVRYNNEI